MVGNAVEIEPPIAPSVHNKLGTIKAIAIRLIHVHRSWIDKHIPWTCSRDCQTRFPYRLIITRNEAWCARRGSDLNGCHAIREDRHDCPLVLNDKVILALHSEHSRAIGRPCWLSVVIEELEDPLDTWAYPNTTTVRQLIL